MAHAERALRGGSGGREDAAVARGVVAPGAWFTLGILIATALFAFVDRQVLSLLTEQVSRSLSLRDTQVGLIQGMGSAVFAIVATYPLGYLTDRLDRRLVLSGCVLVWSMGTVACGLAQGFWSLFFSVMAICTGEAGLPALAYSVIPDLFAGERRVRANQVFYVALILSSALGIGFSGAASLALEHLQGSLPAFLGRLEPWRTVFFLVAAPAPLLVALIGFSGLGASRSDREPAAPDGPPLDFAGYLRRDGRTVVLTVAALAVSGLPFLAILVWTPAALTRLFQVTPGQNGFAMGLALAVGCLCGVAAAGWLQHRFRAALAGRLQIRLSCLALISALPVAGLYALADGRVAVMLAVTLLMGVGTFTGSMLPNILQGLAPAQMRGRVVAMYGVLQMFVEGLGVTLVGPLAALFPGDRRALLIGVATLLVLGWSLGAVLLWLAERPYAELQARLAAAGQPD